jgi:hypothetical protein
MLQPKAFLHAECLNVDRLLRNTLRYDYSSKSSAEVYLECLARLRIIRDRLSATDEADGNQITELSVQLSELSQLVGRVERSHIEEFSWPFAAALQDLAMSVCDVTDDESSPPLFFMSADDELFSYQIRTEQNDPGLMARPLFNIIFPRSLKHFVLLHPILAHEVGHAAFAIPELGANLEDKVLQLLRHGSPLNDLAQLAAWAKSAGHQLDMDELTIAAYVWPEELYCDLFGLLMMGPSYIAASSTLHLGIHDPSDSHPGSLSRYWMLNEAVKCLGWRAKLAGTSKSLSQPVKAFFDSLSIIADTVPEPQRLLKARSIHRAVKALKKILGGYPGALFQLPAVSELEAMVNRLLRARPPIESTVSQKLSVSNSHVDFRHILLAGWLAWHSKRRSPDEISFLDLNLLCDRGILQQSAVDRWAKTHGA